MINPKMYQKPAVGIGIAALVAVLCLAALASDSARIEKPAAVDAEQYAGLIENEVFDIQDLAEGAEIQRRRFNRMTPPGFSWVQPMFPAVVPFDAENFDEKFLDELLAEDKNSVAIYPLSLTLDPKTRETLVFNAKGKLIATIPADRFSREWPEDADPARVTLQLDLLPSEDVEPYLYTESRIVDYAETLTAKATKSSGMVLRSLGASEFGIAGVQRLTNGSMRITVTNGADTAEVYSYTVWHNSTITTNEWVDEYGVTNISTNTLWTPISPPFNGIESEWECLTTNLALSGGVGVYDDANITSNARVRFYAVANRLDSDGDGLSDGAEIFIHRTDPGISDTDGDGIPDGTEILLGLNPLEPSDANEDPDGDHLTNLEEYELGLPMLESNEVTFVYYNPNPAVLRRTTGGGGYIFLDQDNLEAKAVSTYRQKEGYPEYTNSFLPPSDPPKWYLGREYCSFAEGDGIGSSDNYIYHCIHSSYNYCFKQFDPAGWPLAPTNHLCSGNEDVDYWATSSSHTRHEGWDYSFAEPSESVPIYYFYTSCYSGYGCTTTYSTGHIDSCSSGPWIWFDLEPYSHTESYCSNNFNYWAWFFTGDGSGYEAGWETLTNEYTTEMLLTYTSEDLPPLLNWSGLTWGQRWTRENHRQEPWVEDLPTNEYYSASLLSEDHTNLFIQDLQYRWTIPTASNVVYKLMWLEAFRPQGMDSYIDYQLRSFPLIGTGGDIYTPTYTAGRPWTNEFIPYGTIEPIGFLVQLESSLAEKSPMGFGSDPLESVSYLVVDNPAEAAKSDQNKMGRALTILFNKASTPEGDPVDFDVTLRVIPETLPGVTWALDDGPTGSGTLLDSSLPVATFRNPTKGGIYTFSTTIPGVEPLLSQLWLPVSGPDISVDFQREIDYLANWISVYNSYQEQRALSSMPVEHHNDPDKITERKSMLWFSDLETIGLKFDYETPNSRLQGIYGLAHEETPDDSAGDSARFVIAGTTRPYVTDFAKRNNMGLAIYAYMMNVPFWFIPIGPDLYLNLKNGKKVGTKDDQYARESYAAGILLAQGTPLPSVVESHALDMQHPAARVSLEWPGEGMAETNTLYLNPSTRVLLENAAGR